jgi:hypothetical protein
LAIASASACAVLSGLDRLVEKDCVEPCEGATDAMIEEARSVDSSHHEAAAAEAAAVDAGEDSIDASHDSPADRSSPDADDGTAAGDSGDARPSTDAPVADTSGDARPSTDAPIADASMCKNDLSNIGRADFHISLTMTTTQTGQAAVVNQRTLCGFAMFWDITLDDKGRVFAETDDYSPTNGSMTYASVTSAGAVNDGRPHAILFQRVAQVLTVKIDGAASGPTPSVSDLRQLPPLLVGQDACDSPVRAPFVGTITNVCATSP